jgi:TorA maturation chaperone TorD
MVAGVVNEKLLADLEGLFSRPSVDLLQQFAQDFDGDLESLRIEYSNLFVVPLGQYIKPYESVYKTGLVYRGPAIEVKKMYEKAGAGIPEEFKDLPDHVGLELEFMHFLCQKEAKLWNHENQPGALTLQKMEKNFLEQHLTSWIPAFCQEINKRTKNPFYRAMAKITRDFVLSDQTALDKL